MDRRQRGCPVALRGVDDGVGAELAHPFGLGRCAGGGHDGGSRGAGDLDRGAADATGCGMDEHGLPGLDLAEVMQAVPGGEPRGGQAGGRGVVDAVGNGHDVRGGNHRLLAVEARFVRGAAGDHAGARFETGDAAAHSADGAAGLQAEHERRPAGAVVPACAGEEVGPVDAGGADVDEDLAGAGRRGRGVGQVQYLGGTEVVEHDAAHRGSPVVRVPVTFSTGYEP